MTDRREFLRTTGALALGATGLDGQGPGRLNLFEALSHGTLPPGAVSHDAANRMAWWRDARFGMFVHWGLYSILAGEWGGRTDYAEWIRNNAKIPIDEYDKLMGRFNPTEFDADRLASLAAGAGAKYLVITTKHHDGFCLFDTKQTDFNAMHTPYKRDIMRMVADACRAHGVRPCWYHSIMDWHHPDYLPRRDWERGIRPVDGAQFDRYVRYLHAEVEELLTHYGDVGVLWFDGEWENTWTRELGMALADRCRALAPNLIINSRVAPKQSSGLNATLSKSEVGDFSTPEQEIPDRGIPGVDWESCVTMNGNWGYNRADHNFKSVPKLVSMLIETASKGGNLLLNVGPTGEGLVPPESVDRLQGIGRWMSVHADAIRGTSASPFANASFRATSKKNLLYSFLPEWPAPHTLLLPGVRTLPRAAWMMGDSSRQQLAVMQREEGVMITLPERATDSVCSVLACEFDAPVRVP